MSVFNISVLNRYALDIPENIRNNLKEGECVIWCDNLVLCMTEDVPKISNPPIDIEVDREGRDVILRNIIKDDPNNPLYLEYAIDKNFVDYISKSNIIRIIFVNDKFSQEKTILIHLDKEDLSVIRREVGLGSF
ncbi:hypothetical protein [Acidianus brierleyi]|uniref:hypothetical protein n=1 Tax=Acidianus brierleyi TaxID=41673 RepID=UPI001FEBCE20|nr:hypothetical protein [Acidianus brierleyi]